MIVCPCHPSLDLSKGVVSKSILEVGGEQIEDDLSAYLNQNGPPRAGTIVCTSPGQLRCKAAYFMAIPRWRDDHGKVKFW